MKHQITVWFVGDNPAEALTGLVFDDPECAEEFRSDNGYEAVYSFYAVIDTDSVERVQ